MIDPAHQPILGRGPLVRNLLKHLLKGMWAVVSGGPKLGKTTLLQQVEGEFLANHQPVYLDCSRCPAPDLSLSVPQGEKPVILLIDNCHSLLPDPTGFIKQAHDLVQEKRGAVQGIIWAGGVEWGEWVLAHRWEVNQPIRYYPLGVLSPVETRPILLENLPPGASSSEIQRLQELSGGHPYLLKGLLTNQQPHFDDFFFTLWNAYAVRSNPEKAVLNRFFSTDTWIRLEDLRDTTGKKVPKTLLDRLANLGVIIRTLVDGTASARIVSPLFSEWARRSLPPIAKKQPHLMTTHGHTRQDDYFWLRNREDPEVMAYLKAENAYTESQMAHTEELQEKLFQEMKGRIQETDSSAPVKIDRYYYYVRTEEGKQYPVYCRKRDSLDNKEVVILDQNALARNKTFLAVGIHEVSPDHTQLAYSTDTTGAEKYTLCIKDLLTGKLHTELITDTDYSLEWSNDSKSFFYTILDDARRAYKVLKHVLGTNPKQDVLVYHEEDDRYFVSLRKTRSRKYIFIESKSKVTTEVRYLDADSAERAPVLWSPREQEHEYYVDHRGSEFFILTNKNAPNFRLVRTSIASPLENNWQEIVGHREGVTIDRFALFQNYLVLSELASALVKVRIISLDLKEDHYIEFPEPAYAIDGEMNPDFESVLFRFGYSSFITPQTTFDYNMSTRELHLVKRKEVPGGYNKSEYVIERLDAPAPDGTKIPISLTYRKDLIKEGDNPCWLYGYGSYGSVISPRFAETRISLLDRGFVFAMAHIRGGGDLGRSWYDAGKYFHKKNTFADFIACAEQLIREGYAEKEKLVIKGGSAGGLLMGAVLNMRPDLFRAAIASVPFVDLLNTMLDPTLPLTVMEYEEWGNPNDKPYYDTMLAYSPYDNVSKQGYPNLLVLAGLNDPRVQYWEPAKWVAKLRAMKTDTNTLLLKTYLEHGHMGSSGRYNFLKEVAFEYAFALDALGIKE